MSTRSGFIGRAVGFMPFLFFHLSDPEVTLVLLTVSLKSSSFSLFLPQSIIMQIRCIITGTESGSASESSMSSTSSSDSPNLTHAVLGVHEIFYT